MAAIAGNIVLYCVKIGWMSAHVGAAGAVPTLVGIVSTVSADVSANGVVPVSALHELLDHPGRYYHALSDPSARAPSTHTRIIVS
jgi:hypothetical protein